MNFLTPLTIAFAGLVLLFSCSNEPAKENKTPQQPPPDSVMADSVEVLLVDVPKPIDSSEILNADFNQDLSTRSLQELRLMRNAVYAKQGFLFMAADLRGYFTANIKDYNSKMEERFFAEEAKEKYPPVKLSQQEQAFVDKIKQAEAEKLKENYLSFKGRKIGNVNNIINLFQYKNLSQDFMNMIAENNFVIVPGDNIQLFHVYEKNDYNQVPNFVTTDLYLQLFHMYFGYLLKSLENDKFIPIMTELSDGISSECMKIAGTTKDNNIKSVAEYNAVFYAIPYYILNGKKKTIPKKYEAMFKQELANIESEQDNASEFLDFKQVFFPYSLFKPRGHYTRSAELKKYFKAMMWLQTAPYCREKNEQLTQASFTAFVLNSAKGKSGKSLLELYRSVYEPIAFLIGEPDNLSVMDISAFLAKNNLADPAKVTNPAVIEKINKEMIAVGKYRNRIKPKIQISCADKINFMPQRYVVDNEVIENLVDVKPGSNRPFPKGLDVFAAFGNKPAENILLNEYEENKNWDKYSTTLDSLKNLFTKYRDWDKAVYNKWIESLLTMTRTETSYPPFMQSPAWDKKNLNTALASWAELKHDAILYAEQPMAAECGGGGPPDPITVGYVEPNLGFWKKMDELMTLTEGLLTKNNLMTKDIESKTVSIKETATFLLSACEKELRGEKLNEHEYKTIEVIGSSVEYLTLSIIEPGTYIQYWENVQGPDKSVAVVADIYTRNIQGCNKNGILHVATGKVNDIFVVVEIEGNLYLTKGATFSFYEFPQPIGTRLTDEEWQKMLDSKDCPPIPKWMQEIILPPKDRPNADEKIFYSSGC